jgi:hypothetical protein
MVGRHNADRNDVFGTRNDGIGGHGDHGIEIASGQRITQISHIVGKKGLHQSEICA